MTKIGCEIIRVLGDLAVPVVLVAHPRLIARASAFGIKLNVGACVPRHHLPIPE